MKLKRRTLSALLLAGTALYATDVAANGVDGPTVTKGTVREGMTDVYQVVFRGREYAHVQVAGDGDSDLDLYVYDDGGNLVCQDDDYTAQMDCLWVPRHTGMFTVRIRNLGASSSYVMATN